MEFGVLKVVSMTPRSLHSQESHLKANLHAAICRPDFSATINREANWFRYSASTVHALFIDKTFL